MLQTQLTFTGVRSIFSTSTLALHWTLFEKWGDQRKDKSTVSAEFFRCQIKDCMPYLPKNLHSFQKIQHQPPLFHQACYSNYTSNQATHELPTTTQKLASNKQIQQNTFLSPATIQESNTKASYLLALTLHKLGWQRPASPSREGSFSERMHSRGAALLCPVSKNKMCLSHRTVITIVLN